jgi:hypothetical protein
MTTFNSYGEVATTRQADIIRNLSVKETDIELEEFAELAAKLARNIKRRENRIRRRPNKAAFEPLARRN